MSSVPPWLKQDAGVALGIIGTMRAGAAMADAEPVAALLERGLDCLVAGDGAGAEALFRAVLARDAGNPIAAHQLGLIAFGRGDAAEAVRLIEAALAAEPAHAEGHNNLGVALAATGAGEAARAAFERALALRPAYAEAYFNLGAVHEAAGRAEAALDAYRGALAVDPAHLEARDGHDRLCAALVPQWHFPMMADGARNRAYDAALRRLAPGRTVLDIGTGAGLLAMMAARAGARRVTSCEAVPAIAARARAVIAANGLADRIALVARRSDALEIGADLPERAELLVTETFASGLLSEGVLPTLEHARAHLLVEDPVIIPRAAAAFGCLVGGAALEAQFFAAEAGGFALDPFNRFSPFKIGVHLDQVPHEILSDPVELLRLDLTRRRFDPETRRVTVTARRAGRCLGVAQWLWLGLDEGIGFDNRPGGGEGVSHWMHVLYRFPEPLPVEPGQAVRLTVRHNRVALTVARAPG